MRRIKFAKSKRTLIVLLIVIAIVVFVSLIINSWRRNDTKVTTVLPDEKMPTITINSHTCIKTLINEDSVTNKWTFPGWDQAKYSELDLNQNGTFIFKGFYSESFKSSGTWSLIGEDKIRLTFIDNIDQWKKDINEENKKRFVESDSSVVDMGIENGFPFIVTKIIKSGFSPESRCDLNLNFLGWTFTYQVPDNGK